MSRPVLVILALAVIVLIILFATGFFSVEQTREGSLPDIDINAKGGQLPEYEVNAKKVVVGTRKEQIEVPVVSVTNGSND